MKATPEGTKGTAWIATIYGVTRFDYVSRTPRHPHVQEYPVACVMVGDKMVDFEFFANLHTTFAGARRAVHAMRATARKQLRREIVIARAKMIRGEVKLAKLNRPVPRKPIRGKRVRR